MFSDRNVQSCTVWLGPCPVDLYYTEDCLFSLGVDKRSPLSILGFPPGYTDLHAEP